jgi:hypothetical protein
MSCGYHLPVPARQLPDLFGNASPGHLNPGHEQLIASSELDCAAKLVAHVVEVIAGSLYIDIGPNEIELPRKLELGIFILSIRGHGCNKQHRGKQEQPLHSIISVREY